MLGIWATELAGQVMSGVVLTEVIRRTEGTISVGEAAETLQVSPTYAAKMLARWAGKGCSGAFGAGSVCLGAIGISPPRHPAGRSRPVAERLYAPCYIGVWSAAEYSGVSPNRFFDQFWL